MSPIASYLAELARLLRRRGRRRTLAEVRAHLLDAAAARRARGEDAETAQRHAIARFGAVDEVALLLNSVPRRTHRFARRSVAVVLACAASASLGTASVWAFGGTSATHSLHAGHGRGRAPVVSHATGGRRHR